ncbi:proline-rich basic protein 1 [Sorex fumeus]|uniref:proline-rich basic protein 1 n=1 Tax=Sorex fumeus TaxID=62283 RepID=UPI0024ADE719|nr:proline-rich basic protein 1 [Sorex fumeus]
MLTALGPPGLPGLPGRLSSAPARRQDSSGSSGSYHTAPGSPETPAVGPDAEGRAKWPRVAPALGADAQPRLSVSAQNSRQQPAPGSGFPRGPGSDPRPALPQLRTLPSGEMEVIFNAGPLFRRCDAAESEVPPSSQPAFCSSSPPRAGSPAPAAPQDPGPDGGSRWATYLELRPGGPSPATPTQFECVEVALEERAAPARPRTVPKRQIELRPRARSPPREASAPNPRLLLRTGSLDESLGRLQAAANLVQTALARKLGPAALAPSTATFGSTGRPEPEIRDAARSTRVVPEHAKARPPRVLENSSSAKAPRPWPSLRERAIRRDKPAPGTEPLGPVSSSIFLQSGEKTHEAHSQLPKTRLSREPLDRIIPRAQSPPLEFRGPWEVPSKAVNPLWQAPNGSVRGSHRPGPQNLPPWEQAIRRVSSPPHPEASAVEDTASRRSPSPPTLSQWERDVARVGSVSLEAPSPWEIPHHPAVEDALVGSRSPSPQALSSWEAAHHPVEAWETWEPTAQGSPTASRRDALNGTAPEEVVPSAPGTPEFTAVPSPSSRETRGLGDRRLPEGAAPELPLCRLEGNEGPETWGPGEAASGRRRVAIPRPRDVRQMVKTTYAPSFPAGSSGSGQPAPPADPRSEEGGASKTQDLQALGAPAPGHYTSVFLKDFLPVVSHPYEPPEPTPDTAPRDASKPNGAPRRRAENSTAKPFARTEIRLPGALALGRPPDGSRGGGVRAPGGGENRDAEPPRLVPEGEGGPSPAERAAPSSPQRSPVGGIGARAPRPSSPQAHPHSSPGRAARLEASPAAPESFPRAPQEAAGGATPPHPRAASAPPADRSREGPFQGPLRPPGAAAPGKVLVDPESGRYYFVEAPRQPRPRLLFDPENGQYVEVLLPPSPPGPSRRVYTPLALGPGLLPPAYGPLPGLPLPPAPGSPAFSGHQLPWAAEPGPLDGMYYLPVSGTPSPAPPLFLCAPPPSSGPQQPRKAPVFPV